MNAQDLRDCLAKPAPHDLESEMGVLGSVLLTPPTIDEVAPVVRAGDFFDDANGIIFNSLLLLHGDNKPIDITLLVSHLREIGKYEKVGGAAYLARLSTSVPDASNAVHYARTVADRAKLRRIIEASTEAIGAAYRHGGDPVSIAGTLRAKVDQVSAETTGSQCVTLHEAAKQRLELIEHPDRSEIGPLLATGIGCIDETYGGFRIGGSCVIAARPGKGKSALMKQIANSLDFRRKPTLLISLEMEPHEIAARILSERTGIDGKFFEVDENGECQIGTDELERVRRTVDDCQHSVIHIQAPIGRHATIEGISAFARLMKAKHDVKLVAIDYLQLIEKSSPRQTDYEHVTACSKACKRLARELGVVVLLLSQLNRDGEKQQQKPRRPRLSDLRDSGAIEQDGDVVIALHQPDERKPDYELLVLKVRNDATGIFNVRLVGELTKFEIASP